MRRAIRMALSVIMVIAMMSIIATAVEPRMPEIEESFPKTLTISYVFHTENGEKTPIDGATFSIYKVADLAVNGGSADYTTVTGYSSLAKYDEDNREITYNGIEKSESLELAKEMAKIAGEAEAVAKTENGECKFEIADEGIYLVMETAREGAAEGYMTTDPFLITVPMPELEGDGYVWNYAVVSEPKTAVNKVPETTEAETETETEAETTVEPGNTPETIETGNEINIVAWAALGISLLCVLFIVIISRKERHNENQDEK